MEPVGEPKSSPIFFVEWIIRGAELEPKDVPVAKHKKWNDGEP